MKRIISLVSALIAAVIMLSVQPVPAQAVDSAEAMEAYKAVLQNKMTFYSTDDKKNYKLSEFGYWDEEEITPLQVVRFTVIDMGSDVTPKVVLELTSGFDGAFEVLHYEDGKVYGFNHSYRGMLDLTTDGIYSGSNGAADSGFYKMSIKKDTYNEETLGYSKSGADESISYYIGESKVTESQWDEFLDKRWAYARENAAVWHDFTDADIDSVLK